MEERITNQKYKRFVSLFSNPIAGKKIVLIGTGSLGSAMAKLAAPLGANIIGVIEHREVLILEPVPV